MTAKRTTKGAAAEVKLPVSAGTFPGLRQFLRGYLHEDWQEEHDSPAEAARQFCDDASSEERQEVAREWEELRQRTKNLSVPAGSGLLSYQLGAAWLPAASYQI